MSDERITLEEAMDYIDQYLTEKAPRGAYKKYLAMKDKEINDYRDRAKMMSKVASSTADSNVQAEALRKRDENYNNMSKVNRDIRNTLLKGTNDDTAVDDLKRNVKGDGSHTSSDKLTVHSAKEAMGQGKKNMLSKLEKKPAGTFTKESVDALRLRCYESCEAGFITEEERDTYLDYLGNYTEAESYDSLEKYILKAVEAAKNFKDAKGTQAEDSAKQVYLDKMGDLRSQYTKVKGSSDGVMNVCDKLVNDRLNQGK